MNFATQDQETLAKQILTNTELQGPQPVSYGPCPACNKSNLVTGMVICFSCGRRVKYGASHIYVDPQLEKLLDPKEQMAREVEEKNEELKALSAALAPKAKAGTESTISKDLAEGDDIPYEDVKRSEFLVIKKGASGAKGNRQKLKKAIKDLYDHMDEWDVGDPKKGTPPLWTIAGERTSGGNTRFSRGFIPAAVGQKYKGPGEENGFDCPYMDWGIRNTSWANWALLKRYEACQEMAAKKVPPRTSAPSRERRRIRPFLNGSGKSSRQKLSKKTGLWTSLV